MTPNFPGMNPYLESPALWSDVHSWLIVELARELNPSLIPKYRAESRETGFRVYCDRCTRSGDRFFMLAGI